MSQNSSPSLKRELGVVGAVALGLGSIVGAGVFVSTGIAAGVAGPAVIISVAIAACVAVCNGLNSAQLAASHPVSGGAYEYGYKYLTPWLGFTAGWMFLVAKSASAATAALGFAGYLLNLLGISDRTYLVPTALAAVVLLTLIVLGGVRRSKIVNITIVSITLLSLIFFIVAGLPVVVSTEFENFTPFVADTSNPVASVLQATALMFVAYTGYGRIATLGEEVKEPRKTIPKAIIITLAITMLLYIGVVVVGIGTVGAETLGAVTSAQVAPLEIAARSINIPGSGLILAVGAVTATLGVLLNLVLGLSRVLLAMGRRQDMPKFVSKMNSSRTTPYIAVLIMGTAIACLVLIGDVRTTWSFSAFSVLIYYAITDLSALQIPDEQRLYPKWIAWIGLSACLFLAFWVEQRVWLVGIGLIVAGLIWKTVIRKLVMSSSMK
ncbi:amino acid permease [Gloeocapsopsis crepidinum LEGE 06123]|uniref:Amino acid permease n=1 Tax=Gloeocapsopsis crepidinum LEGE 06123 TaxID=588587 RepID=A0ABR9USF4_9CHRO|nr:amino acid permease [Gloeocapsopsis crepidinum]MBE9191232.1 amino acid permease [Gloeocapsopsis crepidinum LEGE 06123]